MGNKSNRIGKLILFYIATGCLIAAVSIVSCAPFQSRIDAIRAHQQLEQYRENMAAGFFETIIEQSRAILAENETKSPADVALYSLGEVYAHHDFSGRDYALSQYYFEKLINNFPDSQLTSEAKTYISLFETIAAGHKTPPKEIIIAEEKKHLSGTGLTNVVKDKNFEEAVKKNLQILDKVGKSQPADVALYNLGLIYAHIDNPAKDYQKSQTYFNALIEQFPDSDLAEEARIWLGLFETIEKIQQIDVDIEQQKKQLTR